MKTSEIMSWLLLLQTDKEIGEKLIEDPFSGEKRKVSTIAHNAIVQVYNSGNIIKRAEDLVKEIHKLSRDQSDMDNEMKFFSPGTLYYICHGCGYKTDKIDIKFCPECGAEVRLLGDRYDKKTWIEDRS